MKPGNHVVCFIMLSQVFIVSFRINKNQNIFRCCMKGLQDFLANAKSYNSEAYLEGLISAASILAWIGFGNYTIFQMVYGLQDIIL